MTGRCDDHAQKQIKKLLPWHKCSTDRDAKPIDVDLLNRYCVEIGVADAESFCPNTPISVCHMLHTAINKKMEKIDLVLFDN